MDARGLLPDFAYVPGKTPRHAEGTFDVFRDTAHAGLSPGQLARCDAFRLGLMYLEEGYYWEAHELFEPVWMVLPDPSPERQFVQGLIQIANGYLKLRMVRPKAASRLVSIARTLVPEASSGALMGVEMTTVHGLINSLEDLLRNEL